MDLCLYFQLPLPCYFCHLWSLKPVGSADCQVHCYWLCFFCGNLTVRCLSCRFSFGGESIRNKCFFSECGANRSASLNFCSFGARCGRGIVLTWMFGMEGVFCFVPWCFSIGKCGACRVMPEAKDFIFCSHCFHIVSIIAYFRHYQKMQFYWCGGEFILCLSLR